MKTKFLLALTLLLALSIGGAFAGTMKNEAKKSETVSNTKAQMPMHHRHHHRHHHHHHAMMHH